MTAQKKILDLTGSQYLVQKVKSAINDVDSSLSTHIADTDIHVTTADKNRWNNQTYVFRYSSTALVASSTNSNTLLDNTDNLKVGDKVIDSSGVLFSITAIDTANSTFTIGTALIDLAQDSDVVHKSGDETISGNKNFTGLTTTAPDSTFWPETALTTDDITFLHASAVHVEPKSPGKLTDLSGGAWNIANLGIGCFFFRYNNGTDIRYKNFAQNTVYRIYIVSNANRQLNDVTPETDNTYNLGDSTRRWSTINGLEPSSLSLPDLSNGIDISSYIPALDNGNTQGSYTPSVNGFIIFRGVAGTGGCSIVQGNMGNNASYITDPQTSNKIVNNFIPVIKDVPVVITAKGLTSIELIYFYPCQGNV